MDEATPQPQSRVLDFGIARATDADIQADIGQLLGTIPYICPEQASGDPTPQFLEVCRRGGANLDSVALVYGFAHLPDARRRWIPAEAVLPRIKFSIEPALSAAASR